MNNSINSKCLTLLIIIMVSVACVNPAFSQRKTVYDNELAVRILKDSSLTRVKEMAAELIKSGFTAGSGYGEVWIRDFNTFIELSCKVMPADSVKIKLIPFFQMQGKDGNIIDGYIPRDKATVGYDYIFFKNAPTLAGHKNTVETDQESSLIQAVYKYINITKDSSFLSMVIDGVPIYQRLNNALEFLLVHRYSSKYGLIYGATTADWGDVQPESAWGVVMDSSSHLAIDIYDNAMFLIAVQDYLKMMPNDHKWENLSKRVRYNIQKYLWDSKLEKYIPHLYLNGSPFPKEFDENAIHFHGGTAVAIEAGLLNKKEIEIVNQHMLNNVQASGAMSIGLTLYPSYPAGYFKNTGMNPYIYQNGGDWTWFGARMITQLIKNGYIQQAYSELKPMIDRVIVNHGFFEWYSIKGKAEGSSNFRGSAGVLYTAILALEDWANNNRHKN